MLDNITKKVLLSNYYSPNLSICVFVKQKQVTVKVFLDGRKQQVVLPTDYVNDVDREFAISKLSLDVFVDLFVKHKQDTIGFRFTEQSVFINESEIPIVLCDL